MHSCAVHALFACALRCAFVRSLLVCIRSCAIRCTLPLGRAARCARIHRPVAAPRRRARAASFPIRTISILCDLNPKSHSIPNPTRCCAPCGVRRAETCGEEHEGHHGAEGRGPAWQVLVAAARALRGGGCFSAEKRRARGGGLAEEVSWLRQPLTEARPGPSQAGS